MPAAAPTPMPAPAPALNPLLFDDCLSLRNEDAVSELERDDVVAELEGEDVELAVAVLEVEIATDVYAKPVAGIEKYAIKSSGAARLNVSDVSVLQFAP
jgi:hypothetical protein